MRYKIRLTIDYDYQQPSDHARNLLHLLPPDIAGVQTVTARRLTIDPAPEERADRLDFFGNTMTVIAFHQPIGNLDIALDVEVQRLPPLEALLDLSPVLEAMPQEIGAVRTLGPLSPHHFIGASPRVGPMPETTDFARSCAAPGMTALQVVKAIGGALFREMRFDANATEVDTLTAEAFAARHGVCQDFSHIMIACLRGLGIPAGYVSGFLRTLPPAGQPRLEGADAMHAWVRAWCGAELGWVEFDPTNNMVAGLDHVVIAVGRDYGDVSPVRGVLRTSGGQKSRQAVDMVPLDGA
jgi:transglutaminase-like putative cysteine protease